MIVVNNLFLIFLILIVFGCGSEPKKETIGDKIDNKINKMETDIKKIDKKVKSKVEDIEDKVKNKVE